jgi:hypothetical protein
MIKITEKTHIYQGFCRPFFKSQDDDLLNDCLDDLIHD